MRMTGLMSGLDTDTIIKQMMDAQSIKKVKIQGKKTKLEWTQDIWKDLNAKIYKLYTDQVSNMRFQNSYKTRGVKSSNESAVTAKADNNAPLGASVIEVKALASSQYITGGALASGVSISSKLKDLVGFVPSDSGKNHAITITSGTGDATKTKRLVVDDNTTLQDFISTCKAAGLNANYDSNQKRLFISSGSSGKDSSFTITTGQVDNANLTSKAAIQNLVNYSSLSTKEKEAVNSAYEVLMKKGEGMNDADFNALSALVINTKKGDPIVGSNPYEEQLLSGNKEVVSALKTLRDYSDTKVENETKKAAIDRVRDEIQSDITGRYPITTTDPALDPYKTAINDAIANGTYTLPAGKTVDVVAKERYQRDQAIKADLTVKLQKKVDDGSLNLGDRTLDEVVEEQFSTYVETDKERYLTNMVSEEYTSTDQKTDSNGNDLGMTKNSYYANKAESYYNSDIGPNKTTAMSNLINNVNVYTNSSTLLAGTADSMLVSLGMEEITSAAMSGLTDGRGSIGNASAVAGADSSIILNGAALTGTTNDITVNGITFHVSAVTTGEVTINVSNDSQSSYDMVKNFLKEYNSLLDEMNKLGDADSSRGYDPLTDEQREAMTDDQVKNWEKKIKDSLLRRDDTLSSLTSAMRTALAQGVEVDGKKYSLSSFGIQTGIDYSEKGLLHIYGDKDDATYRDKTDKLMAALNEDPETVGKVLSTITQNLHDIMGEKMRSTSLSSALTFYNDKQMKKQVKSYEDEIKQWDKRLKVMEDRYYAQFTAMEKAMAQLNSQSSYLNNLMGGGK